MASTPYYDQGKYLGTVRSQGLGKTKTGNAQFILTFQVEGKVDPNDPEGALIPCGEKYDRSIFRVITDNTILYLMEDLAKLGFTGDSFLYFHAIGGFLVRNVMNC